MVIDAVSDTDRLIGESELKHTCEYQRRQDEFRELVHSSKPV
jgi:hypothetical protein